MEHAKAEGRYVENVIHRSDSSENAEQEIIVWYDFLRTNRIEV